jgi:protein-S-isoprenylcysteine O-methyltransferase Ste14
MALREEFERSGNWLFRWRSYLPIFIILMVILSLRDYPLYIINAQWASMWDAFCLIIGFAGLGIRIITIGQVPRGTSGRNVNSHVAESLNTTGIYSVVRNPLYLGNYFMGLAIAFFPMQWWLPVIYSLLFWLYYERIIFSEEAFLRAKFGDIYLQWTETTPPFFPKPFKRYEKSDLTFCVRNVLKREYNGLFALIFLIYVLRIFRDLFVGMQVNVSFGWTALLCTGFVMWMTLRILRKHTKLLYVDGR